MLETEDMKPKLDFEKSLKKLQSIVSDLEGGDLSLEDSLKKFEEGVKTVRLCQDVLGEAQKRVQILTGEKPDGEPDFESLDEPENE